MDQTDTASLAEVLGAVVDADEEIIELERELVRRLGRGKRPRAVLDSPVIASNLDLVMQDYRCTIVSVVARTLDEWKAAGR